MRSKDAVAVGVVLAGLVASLSYGVVLLTRDAGPPERVMALQDGSQDYVVVLTGEGAVEALIAESLGDVVLTLPRSGSLEWLVADVQVLRPTRVLVLGGEDVISEAAVAELSAATTASVTRVAGQDRYTTAAQAATASFRAPVGTLLIAMSESPPTRPTPAGVDEPRDRRPCLPSYRFCGSSASMAAADGTPVLLVTRTAVPPATLRALERLRPTSVTVVGPVSEAVVQVLERHTAGEVRRAAAA